jgi:hypothetical protein
VRKVTGTWQRREGSTLIQYFSIETFSADTFELCFDPRGARWVLTRAWSETK